MRKRLGRPSPAMIVAVIALIGAFGGSAIADDAVDFARSKLVSGSKIKKRSIKGDRLKRNTVTGREVAESKLGKVRSAANSDKAKSADTATNATNATNAANATNATTAGNADNLDGKDSAAFTARWALVGGDGTVLAQSGGISVTKGAGNGRYYVNFGASLVNRPLSVSAVYDGANDNEIRAAKVVLCGGAGNPGGVTCVVAGTNNVNTAYVEVLDETNATVNTPFFIHLPPTG